jgi:hypothetical protein
MRLKLRNLSFLGPDRMDNLMKAHSEMALNLGRAGLIRQWPGVARSIQPLVEPDAFLILGSVDNQTVKSFVQRY